MKSAIFSLFLCLCYAPVSHAADATSAVVTIPVVESSVGTVESRHKVVISSRLR